MKRTITLDVFRSEFYKDPTYVVFFSDEGLEILYNYLIDLEKQTGKEIEFDIKDICSKYVELGYWDIIDNYELDLESCETDNEIDKYVEAFLKEKKAFIGKTKQNTYVFNYSIINNEWRNNEH